MIPLWHAARCVCVFGRRSGHGKKLTADSLQSKAKTQNKCAGLKPGPYKNLAEFPFKFWQRFHQDLADNGEALGIDLVERVLRRVPVRVADRKVD